MTLFSEHLVRRLGHCFRHPEAPLFQFLSRSSTERLTSLRLVGRKSEVSHAKLVNWLFLHDLGLSDELASGRFPQVRGHTGFVFRGGKGWFEKVRERLGWKIEKHDKPEITKRVNMLLHLFRRTRTKQTLAALSDACPSLIAMAIEDGRICTARILSLIRVGSL